MRASPLYLPKNNAPPLTSLMNRPRIKRSPSLSNFYNLLLAHLALLPLWGEVANVTANASAPAPVLPVFQGALPFLF